RALFFFCIQNKSKGGAYIRFAANMDALAVCFNNMFADGKPQAASSFLPAPGGIRTVKSFRYPRNMFFGNAYAVVAYFYQHVLFVCYISAGCYITAGFAVLYCIVC